MNLEGLLKKLGHALPKWIEGLPRNITDVHLHSDSCRGQNKNCPLSAMLMHLANIKRIKISHTHLQPDRFHIEADSIHALIEKCKKLLMLLSKFREIGYKPFVQITATKS